MGETLESDSGDHYGYSVSLSNSGNSMAIGAPDALDTFGLRTGKVETYDWHGIHWAKMGVIYGDPKIYSFGETVKLSPDGKVLAISDREYVYFYDWEGGWKDRGVFVKGRVGPIDMVEDSNGDLIIALSFPTYNSWDSTSVGKIEFYRWKDRKLEKVRSTIEGKRKGTFLGTRTALSSDATTIAYSSGSLDVKPEIKVAVWYNGNWAQIGWFTFDDYDFVMSLVIGNGGKTIAFGHDDKWENNIVEVYEYDGFTWYQVGLDLRGSGVSGFGWRLAMHDAGTKLVTHTSLITSIYSVKNDDVSLLQSFTDPVSYGGSGGGSGVGESRPMDISGDGKTVARASWPDSKVQVYREDFDASIKETNIEFNVFPNPTNGQIEITSSITNYGTIDFVITNSLGKIVISAQLEEGQKIVDLSQLEKGIYFVELKADGAKYLKKIVLM
jgi:hypothetical protein